MITSKQVTAVILAGGEGNRMGGIDKGLVELNGRPLIEYVISNIAPQLNNNIIISANRNLNRYQTYGYLVIVDQLSGSGPLAGILQALQQCKTEWLLTVPCDTPGLPDDLVAKLLATVNQTEACLVTAHDGKRLQPLCSMIRSDMAAPLQHYLEAGNRKVALWLEQQKFITVDFSDNPQAFENINNLKQLEQCTQKNSR